MLHVSESNFYQLLSCCKYWRKKMILDIYNDSIKYSIKNSKSLLYFGLTLFSTFIIWMAYILILIHYQEANLNLKFASLIVPSLLTLIPIFLFLGYEYRILEISTHGMINGTDKVPEFNNLKEMLINGVKIFLVKFVYFAVPIIIPEPFPNLHAKDCNSAALPFPPLRIYTAKNSCK